MTPAERLVTIDRETHVLPANFTVFATQNPIEYEGTFPLPEAQIDRFMLRVSLGYPSAADERHHVTANAIVEVPWGFKLSGIGSKAGGPDYLLQFVLPRTITENQMRRGFAPETGTGE